MDSVHEMRARERAPLTATPALGALLTRLARSLRAQIWVHGLGTIAGALGLALLVAFIADWSLHLPLAVRWLVLASVVGLPLVLAWRELVRHLRRMPRRAELALLIERQHPDLRELLVSAVQFQESPADAGAPDLVRRVLRDADARAAGLDLAGVLAPREPRARMGLGAAATVAVLALVNFQPELAGIFFARLFGSGVAWPKRTELALSIPADGERARITETPDGLEVRVALGSDVPVLVRAVGEVPDEVTLHFAGGETLVLGAGSDGTFRTLLRGTQSDLDFTATGGDDRDEHPRVRVFVLQPPDVAGIAVTVTPPAYTGWPARVELDRDVEVLAGSRVQVAMLPSPANAHGVVRLLPEDRTLPLSTVEFPPETEGAPARAGLGFEVVAGESLRYRFELVDDTGLANPDPGLFGIRVALDQRPEVELIAPLRAEVETIAGGTLRLRARASDDFGVVALGWRARDLSRENEPGALTPFEFESSGAYGALDGARDVAVGGARLDIASLVPMVEGAPAVESGTLFELTVQARDNRPALADGAVDPAGVGSATPVRVRVLSADEFLRRLQDRLARLRVQAAELDELQRQKTRRAEELLAALESDSPQVDARANPVQPVLSGQRRVQADAEALSRELASVLESVLYARIDDSSGALLEDLDQRLAGASAKGFQLDLWRAWLANWRAAPPAATGLAPQLAGLVELALTISADDAPAATSALVQASEAAELEALHASLTASLERQHALQTHVAELLDRLAEWDNFQAILSLARDILARQKAVRDRTREMLQGDATPPPEPPRGDK